VVHYSILKTMQHAKKKKSTGLGAKLLLTLIGQALVPPALRLKIENLLFFDPLFLLGLLIPAVAHGRCEGGIIDLSLPTIHMRRAVSLCFPALSFFPPSWKGKKMVSPDVCLGHADES
jgi:hypothetical protein